MPPLSLERMEKANVRRTGITQADFRFCDLTITHHFFWYLFTPIDSFMQAMAQKYNRRGSKLACDFHAANHGRERGWRHFLLVGTGKVEGRDEQ